MAEMNLMKHFFSFFLSCLSWSVLIGVQLFGHGFDHYTFVRISEGWRTIGQVCQSVMDGKQQVLSYDFPTDSYVQQNVTSVGEAETTCYVRLCFDDVLNDDILCTPTQEFYVPTIREWVPAYKLQVGDLLLTDCGINRPITYIDFVKNPCTVYSIEVAETHNFFVGRHSILTHNVLLPALCTGFIVPFGAGVGSAAGSFFGPITLLGGAAVGSVIGLVVKAVVGDSLPRYQLTFDANEVEKQLKNNADQHKNNENAQAPGKPTEDDGYYPPKKWDGKKVRNPNGSGYGWPDNKGRIWIPTGQGNAAHGGPHWDVQYPDKNKDNDNIYPGGNIRTIKKK